jgi:predicted MPP superfamily phosphohydrolase
MFRAAWLTDIHLIFLWDRDRQCFDPEYQQFIDGILQTKSDAVFLTGDIAEGTEIIPFLNRLETDLAGCPLYFVLGNHDCYHSSIRAIRQQVTEFCRSRNSLHYLSAIEEPIALTKNVALIGHDGWADGRFGELEWSQARISDYTYVEELREAGEEGRRAKLNSIADEAAAHVSRLLTKAAAQFPRVFLLTHVPPWLEVAHHKGQPCDYHYAPHYASRAMGEAIVAVMQQHLECQLTVLCGHTHSRAEFRPLTNVLAIAGEAEYGAPTVQRLFTLDC